MPERTIAAAMSGGLHRNLEAQDILHGEEQGAGRLDGIEGITVYRLQLLYGVQNVRDDVDDDDCGDDATHQPGIQSLGAGVHELG